MILLIFPATNFCHGLCVCAGVCVCVCVCVCVGGGGVGVGVWVCGCGCVSVSMRGALVVQLVESWIFNSEGTGLSPRVGGKKTSQVLQPTHL